MFSEGTQRRIDFIESEGWEYLPTEGGTWRYVKYNNDGKIIGRQGSDEWHRDMNKYEFESR